jgi:hypothetical protein
MSTRFLGVDRGGHVHPCIRPCKADRKVKPQVTTQIAHSQVRGGSQTGVDMSTPVHPKAETPQTAANQEDR